MGNARAHPPRSAPTMKAILHVTDHIVTVAVVVGSPQRQTTHGGVVARLSAGRKRTCDSFSFLT